MISEPIYEKHSVVHVLKLNVSKTLKLENHLDILLKSQRQLSEKTPSKWDKRNRY